MLGQLKAVLSRAVWAILPIAFLLLFGRELMPVIILDKMILYSIIVFFLLHLCVLTFALLLRGPTRNKASKLDFVLFAVLLLLAAPFAFIQDAFGTRDLSSLLMTVSENQFGTLVSVGVEGFKEMIAIHLVRIAALLVAAWLLARYVWFGRATLLATSVLLLVFSPVPHHLITSFVPNPAHALVRSDEVLQGPVIERRPTRHKNIVIVYLESLERIYRDLEPTRAAFEKLAELEDEGLSFRNLGQAYGTGFTAGGMVATQCAVPLLPRGAFNIANKIREKTELVPAASDFMNDVMCLGDVLNADGYNASYINGSELDIYSKGDFFRSHGYARVFGLSSYDGWETERRRNIWGMDDDLLFERVFDEIDYLVAQDAPFLLSTLTIATHGPDAYLDRTCDASSPVQSQIPAAIECTADHVEALLDKLDYLGILDETLVVLLSDHLVFKNSLSDLMPEQDGRRNFAVVLGAGRGVIEREGTTLDIYPTLLELLGYEIRESRAALGQSLISEPETFVEREGIEMVNRAIKDNSELQRSLWSIN